MTYYFADYDDECIGIYLDGMVEPISDDDSCINNIHDLICEEEE